MAIKDMISPGIGFTPGSVQFIVTRGLGVGAVVATSPTTPDSRTLTAFLEDRQITPDDIRIRTAQAEDRTVEA